MTFAHDQSSEGLIFLSHAPVDSSFFFCDHVRCTYHTHITWAVRNERRTGQRVDRYTHLELSRPRIGPQLCRLYRMVFYNRVVSFRPTCQIPYGYTNKVREKDALFLSAKGRQRTLLDARRCHTFDEHEMQITGYRSMISGVINGDVQAIHCNHRCNEYISEDIT